MAQTYESLKQLFRRLTWRARVLPDFLVIGAQKAGTTSLAYYLSQHPGLVASHEKEVHYFDGGLNESVDTYDKGESWYRSYFPRKTRMKPGNMAFEASPAYLFNPLVSGRVFDQNPKMKMIALLRNPTERAISHYRMEKKSGRETLPLMEALVGEEERLSSCLRSKDYKSQAFRYHSYKSRGLYYEQLLRYHKLFAREQLLVLSGEAFFNNPKETLRQIFSFLGVDRHCEISDLAKENVGSKPQGPPIEAIEYLNDYFDPHNKQLYDYLGSDFGWARP